MLRYDPEGVGVNVTDIFTPNFLESDILQLNFKSSLNVIRKRHLDQFFWPNVKI